MNQGRTVFSQLIAFLPDREFRRCVARYDGDARLRDFSCWDRYLTMAFAQLTYRESLRDIEACLRVALGASLYQILQILSVTLFEKTPILQAFTHPAPRMIYSIPLTN
jgi:hypothetical protein